MSSSSVHLQVKFFMERLFLWNCMCFLECIYIWIYTRTLQFHLTISPGKYRKWASQYNIALKCSDPIGRYPFHILFYIMQHCNMHVYCFVFLKTQFTSILHHIIDSWRVMYFIIFKICSNILTGNNYFLTGFIFPHWSCFI